MIPAVIISYLKSMIYSNGNMHHLLLDWYLLNPALAGKITNPFFYFFNLAKKRLPGIGLPENNIAKAFTIILSRINDFL